MRMIAYAAAFAAMLASDVAFVGSSQASLSRIEAALTNILTLQRPGEDGFATIWDGNKYVQCRSLPERALRCEAAGALMQPSLGRVLGPERIARLEALGWQLDPSFGNYVQTFPADVPAGQVADRIVQALKEGYDADMADLDVQTDWIRSSPCPPRNGPSQNLAGMINDHPSMAATAVRGCAYEPTAPAQTAAQLIETYGARVSGELQRLRVNVGRSVFVVLGTGTGYVQCGPVSEAIYCEAQSADSWAGLAHILTPDRVARLHAAGFADPGRSPNYWKIYPVPQFSDTAISNELLTLLHDIYGYNGTPKLEFKTERRAR